MFALSDTVIPFQLEHSHVRGRITCLDAVVRQIIEKHAYPAIINKFLAEAIALSVVVANCFKFDGLFTLQISGDGPVRLMVIDVTSTGNVRACVRFSAENVAKLSKQSVSVQQMMGAGHLAFTIAQENNNEQYQGIVALTGTTLAECMHHFFRQSEQLETGIIVVSRDFTHFDHDEGPLVGALMVQRLPIQDDLLRDQADDIWVKTLSAVGTVHSKELLDAKLNPKELLYRLFWEDGVRVYEEKNVRAQCRCSRTKIEQMLKTFSPTELGDMIVDEKIEVTCEFCNEKYDFDPADFLIKVDE